MSDCIFCKIIAGEIPSRKVYEDDFVLAFYDLEPQAPFHVLIIPKVHIASAMELTGENSGVVSKVFEAAVKIAQEYHLDNGFRIVNNCGKDGNQTVQHLHFHMLGGRLLGWPPG
jgi:histidine triad (HIT) family protein